MTARSSHDMRRRRTDVRELRTLVPAETDSSEPGMGPYQVNETEDRWRDEESGRENVR